MYRYKNSVAILLPFFNVGGTEIASIKLASQLVKLNYKVDIIVYFNEIDNKFLHEEIKNNPSLNFITLRIERKLYFLPFLFFRLLFLLKKNKYKIIWIQYVTPTLMPILLSKFFCKKLFLTLHTTYRQYNKFGLLRIRFFARFWCNKFFCVSKTIRKNIFYPTKFSDNKSFANVKILPNTIDSIPPENKKIMNWKRIFKWQKSSFIIGYVGRLEKIKGVDILISEFGKISQIKSNLRLVIVGNGSLFSKYKLEIEKLNISDSVKFYGSVYRCNIFSAIKGFDLIIVPSRDEGYGLVALESMACGVPIIVSSADGLKGLVKDGYNGLIFDLENTGKLSKLILKISSDRKLRFLLRANAIKYASKVLDQSSYPKKLNYFLTS